MKVVVLGASGNAGTALLRALEAEPAVGEVGAAARRPPDRWESVKTVWRAVDVAADPLEPVLAGADVVVHLAWLIQPSRDREQTRAVNVGGSRRVMEAVAAAGVPSLVYASSVGAYSPGPKDRRVDETWPTGGVPSSFYSRDKAEVEWLLDVFEREHPDIRVVRLRPGLIFQRGAASEIRRLFAGPFLPSRLVAPKWIPIVPRHPRLRFQAVHADDVADAYRRAIVGDARGAFNVAAEPVLDGEALGRLLDARPVPVPAPVLRGAAAAAFHLRLTPTPAGWVDMALAVPLMDSTRAREVLGWQPTHDAGDVLLELLEGIRTQAGSPTPTLEPGGDGRPRAREILSGVGARGQH
ncbi:MAG: NAD-dependent epimerase/dehydratase family protein [Solirubrobacteraceae bacterium]